MVSVVETFRKISIAGDLKIINIKTSAACATGHTINLDSDATDAKGVAMTEILNTVVQDDVGTTKLASHAPATGIITMGTLSTGIHNVTVIGY